jgi:hypothetical protein
VAHAYTLGVEWSPFLRGIIVVLIGLAVLCGSVYVVLGTNLGARLGFLVAVAGFFGWVALMAAIWWVYGIGLKGKDPSWHPVAVINAPAELVTNRIVGGDGVLQSSETTEVDGWTKLAPDDPERGQAVAAADDILQNQTQVLKAGDYITVVVYEKGGERYPKIGDFDFVAFLHKPHYALVQVQPVIKQSTEAGKAPPPPQPDPNAPPKFVLMERDLGNRRRPAALITIGSTIIFLFLCYSLHRREKLAAANRAATAPTSESLEPVEPSEPAGV